MKLQSFPAPEWFIDYGRMFLRIQVEARRPEADFEDILRRVRNHRRRYLRRRTSPADHLCIKQLAAEFILRWRVDRHSSFADCRRAFLAATRIKPQGGVYRARITHLYAVHAYRRRWNAEALSVLADELPRLRRLCRRYQTKELLRMLSELEQCRVDTLSVLRDRRTRT